MKPQKPFLFALTLFCIGLTRIQAQTVTDVDGNVYNTVNIGAQTWMKENLKTTKFNDGTAVPFVRDTLTWAGLSTPAYCWIDTNPAIRKIYGPLYNWFTVDSQSNGDKNVCPIGWHVPSDAEWKTLTDYLGGESKAGGKLKEAGNAHWRIPNTGATNESDFTALPSGFRSSGGYFYGPGGYGYWWSTTDTLIPLNPNDTLQDVFIRELHYDKNNVFRSGVFREEGYSIRCLKNVSDTAPIANFTALPTNIIRGQNVKFNDHSLNGPTTWSWIFGDGGTSTSQNPIYSYSTVGIFTVTLTATNSFGTDSETKTGFITVSESNGDTILFNPNLTYGTMNDIDGNTYKTIHICTQTWMAENLKTTKFSNGDDIQNVTDSATWANMVLPLPALCWYNNDSATYTNPYGALYNWHAVNTGKLCPSGWHVPTDSDWTTLIDCLSDISLDGGKLKETGTTHWAIPNKGATNETGFTALPGGARDHDGSFDGVGGGSFWWSATENNPDYAWSRFMLYDRSSVTRYIYDKESGFSIRCLKGINTSIPNSLISEEVIFYPNPATDKLYLKNSNFANSIIMIFDLQGKQILCKQIDSNPIDISNLRTGIYVVKLVGSENVLITKFIKE
jgi:uncharacterized protein (TIGR02145 family)